MTYGGNASANIVVCPEYSGLNSREVLIQMVSRTKSVTFRLLVRKTRYWWLGLVEDVGGFNSSLSKEGNITHYGLVVPYGDNDLVQHWLWQLPWRHQTIDWTNVDLSVRSSVNHLRASPQEISWPSITKNYLTISQRPMSLIVASAYHSIMSKTRSSEKRSGQ